MVCERQTPYCPATRSDMGRRPPLLETEAAVREAELSDWPTTAASGSSNPS